MVTVGRNVNIRERLPLRRPLQDPFPKQTFFALAGNPVRSLRCFKSKDEGEGGGEEAHKFKVWFSSPTYSYDGI